MQGLSLTYPNRWWTMFVSTSCRRLLPPVSRRQGYIRVLELWSYTVRTLFAQMTALLPLPVLPWVWIAALSAPGK